MFANFCHDEGHASGQLTVFQNAVMPVSSGLRYQQVTSRQLNGWKLKDSANPAIGTTA
jgi:hypothetical protein